MIDGRPRESLVQYENPIEVSDRPDAKLINIIFYIRTGFWRPWSIWLEEFR